MLEINRGEDQEKTCHNCKNKLLITNFYKDKTAYDGYCCYCKTCKNSKLKGYEDTNPSYKIKKKIRSKKNYNENSEEIKKKVSIWCKNNRIRCNINHKRRRDENPIAQLAKLARDRLYKATQHKFTKNKPTQEVIGLTWEEYEKWIQSHFQEGMTYENRGKGKDKWNVDHAIPLEWAKSEEDIYKLSHYTNLKPMWSKDNEGKRNFYGEIWDGKQWNKVTKEQYQNIK